MLDYIFPHFCIGCDEEGTIVCKKCQRALPVLGVFVPLEGCSSLDDHIAIGHFEENSLLEKLIYAYKYNFMTEVLDVFARMIHEFLEGNKKYFEAVDLIVSVPLHKRRFAERGFNQAEEIARILSQELNITMQNILLRDKATRQQAKLHKQERIENVKEAFVLISDSDIKNKNIIVVDDVFTTGSTLGECARVMKENGARTVKAFTVARG